MDATATPGSAPDDQPFEAEWLSLPEAAALLGWRLRDVRSALADRRLLAKRPDGGGPPLIPRDFLVAGPDGPMTVLPSLRGTATLLSDSGLDDDAAVGWLLAEDGLLGTRPVTALRAGRIHEVRRAAQLLA